MRLFSILAALLLIASVSCGKSDKPFEVISEVFKGTSSTAPWVGTASFNWNGFASPLLWASDGQRTHGSSGHAPDPDSLTHRSYWTVEDSEQNDIHVGYGFAHELHGTFAAGAVFEGDPEDDPAGSNGLRTVFSVYNIDEDKYGGSAVFCQEGYNGGLRWYWPFPGNPGGHGAMNMSSPLVRSWEVPSIQQPPARRLDPVLVHAVASDGHLYILMDMGPQLIGTRYDEPLLDDDIHNPWNADPTPGDETFHDWQIIDPADPPLNEFPPQAGADSNVIDFHETHPSSHVFGSPVLQNIHNPQIAINGHVIYTGYNDPLGGASAAPGRVYCISYDAFKTNQQFTTIAEDSWAISLDNIGAPSFETGTTSSTPAVTGLGNDPAGYDQGVAFVIVDNGEKGDSPSSEPRATVLAINVLDDTMSEAARKIGISRDRQGIEEDFPWYRWRELDGRPTLISPVLADEDTELFVSTPEGLRIYDVSNPAAMDLEINGFLPASPGLEIGSMPIVDLLPGGDDEYRLTFIENRHGSAKEWRVRIVDIDPTPSGPLPSGPDFTDIWFSDFVPGTCETQPYVEQGSGLIYVADNQRLVGFDPGTSPAEDVNTAPAYAGNVFSSYGRNRSSVSVPVRDTLNNENRRIYLGSDDGTSQSYQEGMDGEDDYFETLSDIEGNFYVDGNGDGDHNDAGIDRSLDENDAQHVLLTVDGLTIRDVLVGENGDYIFDDLGAFSGHIEPGAGPYEVFTPPYRLFDLSAGDIEGQDFLANGLDPDEDYLAWSSWGNTRGSVPFGTEAPNRREQLFFTGPRELSPGFTTVHSTSPPISGTTFQSAPPVRGSEVAFAATENGKLYLGDFATNPAIPELQHTLSSSVGTEYSSPAISSPNGVVYAQANKVQAVIADGGSPAATRTHIFASGSGSRQRCSVLTFHYEGLSGDEEAGDFDYVVAGEPDRNAAHMASQAGQIVLLNMREVEPLSDEFNVVWTGALPGAAIGQPAFLHGVGPEQRDTIVVLSEKRTATGFPPVISYETWVSLFDIDQASSTATPYQTYAVYGQPVPHSSAIQIYGEYVGKMMAIATKQRLQFIQLETLAGSQTLFGSFTSAPAAYRDPWTQQDSLYIHAIGAGSNPVLRRYESDPFGYWVFAADSSALSGTFSSAPAVDSEGWIYTHNGSHFFVFEPSGGSGFSSPLESGTIVINAGSSSAANATITGMPTIGTDGTLYFGLQTTYGGYIGRLPAPAGGGGPGGGGPGGGGL